MHNTSFVDLAPSGVLGTLQASFSLPLIGLDASIVEHPEYLEAFSSGYRVYFNDDFPLDYAYGSVVEQLASFIEGEIFIGLSCPDMSLAYCVGRVYGWLSALALTDGALALQGCDLLVSLASVEQRKVTMEYCLPSRSVGLDGWPLDM